MTLSLRRVFSLFSILISVAGWGASVCAFYLFEGFDRETLSKEDLSFTGPIGIVEFIQGNHAFRCTGTLVSADLVLTNAHCVLGGKDGLKASLRNLSFYPSADRFSLRKRGGLGRRYRADTRSKVWLGKKKMSDSTIPSDWAFFRLRRPVPTPTKGDTFSTVLLMDGPTAAELFGTSLQKVSYNGDINRSKLEIVRRCIAQREKDWNDQIFNTVDMLVHSCSGQKGSSGAGILADVYGSKKLIALHVGGQYAENPKESLSKEELKSKREGGGPIPFDDYRFNVGAPSLSFYPTLRQLLAEDPKKFPRQQRREIQEKLSGLGFSVGSIDGIVGKKTRGAIEVFQKSTGSLPTGRLTEHQLDLLFAPEFRVFAAGKTARKVFEAKSESLQDGIDKALALCFEERPDCHIVSALTDKQCLVDLWGLPVHRTLVFGRDDKTDLSYRMLMSGSSSYMERRILYQNCWSPRERLAFVDPFSGPH